MKNLKIGVYMAKTIKESSTYITDKSNQIPIVEQMEKEWSEMTDEFKRLQREQYELFCRKQHDYGPK